MPLTKWRFSCPIIVAALAAQVLPAQPALTWQQVRERFEATNPTLTAARTNIDEARANEITAYLRPNPDLTVSVDQIDPFTPNPYRPFNNTLPFGSISYLHERQHKRELRRDAARKSTDVAESGYADQERTLLFNLRNAFVQTLQAKAVLQNARENLDYWDKALDVNRTRFRAGDLAQVDLDRLELQRVQFESDFEVATSSLRTSKIQLLMLLNDRTPLEQFDVQGSFDFTDE